MTSSKSTKRALISSILAIIVCVSMLVGTTFAWFTDTASTAVNKIQAGTLDVQLLMYDGTNYVDISDDNRAIFGTGSIAQNNNAQTLWEPGKTQVAYLAIKNNGNLALKYKVALDVDNVSKNLYEVMEYAITPDATNTNPVTAWTSGNSVVEGTQVVSTDVSLPAGATHNFALSVHMKEEAGNTYQNGEVDFDLTVYATQNTVEYDSNNNTYDANATYELVKFAFDNPTEEIAFCPVCYNAGTTDNHANHDKYIKIENGVAKVEKTGAWLNFADLDWDNNTYLLEYDVDLSDLATGDFVAFDSGETATWNDLHLGFKRDVGEIKAYKTLFTTSLGATTELGVIGDNVHVVYKYSVNAANALDMQMVISDGTNTYTAEKTVNNFNKSANICWDVYTADGTSATFAKLDNLVFSSISK